MHEHVLECFLHRRGTLGSGLSNEHCDRRVLQRRLLEVQLEILEVFVSGRSKHSHILFKTGADLLPECFRAL